MKRRAAVLMPWLLSAAACVGQAPAPDHAAAPAANQAAASGKASGQRIAPCSKQRAQTLLIENAEDGDGSVALAGGRTGGWFDYKDEAGTKSSFGIQPGGAEGSQRAAQVKGELTSAEVVYAGMGISLGQDPYDASMYRGVAFRARVGAASTRKVRFTVSDIHTEPAGGFCKNCYNHFGVDLELSAEWKRYELAFDELSQAAGWGDKVPEFVPNAVYSLGWALTDKGQPFELWVDDVTLLGCE